MYSHFGPIRIALLVPLFLAGCSPSSNKYQEPPPPSVSVARPIQQDVTLFLEQNGETEPADEADVRARVMGFIEKISFLPGDKVSKGDVLYEIEPDRYQADQDSANALLAASHAAVSVARANEEKAKAELLRTERDFTRQEKLLVTKAISPADYDASLSQRDAAAANLTAAKASIEAMMADEKKAEASLAQANLNLNYTKVKAPISGRITKTLIKEGNLVDIGTPLAMVVDARRVFVNFSISDRLLLQIKDAHIPEQREEIATNAWRRIPVFVKTESGRATWLQGRLDYFDEKGVDQSTGTFALRAVFDNDKADLIPGLFVQVRLPVEQLENAILIPLRAVQRSQLGDFVFVVDSNNKVERRVVSLGNELDSWVLVEDGLKVEESVVVDGLLRARPGSVVDPELVELNTDDSPLLHVNLPSRGESPDENPTRSDEKH